MKKLSMIPATLLQNRWKGWSPHIQATINLSVSANASSHIPAVGKQVKLALFRAVDRAICLSSPVMSEEECSMPARSAKFSQGQTYKIV